ncbi:hypothetical protein KSP39_PZI002585 [Platanthera zijinensis]|uniref:SNRNP25 ubiquitin-like domain-containing protein n=1 Tax=Platanthera zijinensis TaxID=2320716 RepID=A0AAP0C0W1_9ASPA
MRGIVGLEENEPRLPFYRSPSPPGSAAVSFPHRQSFSYYRLPVQLIKLTILKLDGTSFDVHVSREASVLELKMAVEEVFCQSQNRPNENISWSHVWGQFCLSYEGLKLIEEKALLKNFGIKDGDQLQFIRHLSVICTTTKHQRRGHATNAEWRRKSWAGVELIDLEFEESATVNTTVNRRNREELHVTNKDTSQSPDQQEAIICGEEELLVLKNHSQSKLSRCLKDWLCYSSQVYTK